MSTVGNVGIGLLILIFIWIITLIVFVVGVKLQSNISWIALGLASAVTIVLLIIPTDKGAVIEDLDITEKDYSIIYKNLVVGFVWLSALIGFSFFLVLHCLDPIRPKPIKSFNFDHNVQNST